MFEGKAVPEPVGIRSADRKTYRQIHDEIRAALNRPVERLGVASGAEWTRFIASFLLHTFIRLASRGITSLHPISVRCRHMPDGMTTRPGRRRGRDSWNRRAVGPAPSTALPGDN